MQQHLSLPLGNRQSVSLPDSLSWDLLCLEEPQLRRIELEAKAFGSETPGDYRLYSWFKRRLTRFVGWRAKKPALRSDRAFDLAIDRICELLEC